jgi:hypothetical protein
VLTLTGASSSGALSPAVDGAVISIVYTSPDGSTTTHVRPTGSTGSFDDSLRPHDPGVWHVQAHWDGDETHLPADSPSCSFTRS